ncbi:MAG: hypothetical protein WCT44_01070 [Candidatus Paceibacterota bacterium]
MIKIGKKRKNNQGVALLELLFYIALFTMLSLVVINAMITMARSFKETATQAELIQSGSIMERISREIRQASSITSISATDLKLNAVEFKLSGSDLQLFENNIFIGNLNTPNIAITGLVFTEITTAQGKAIKIFLSLKSNNDISARIVDFYDTVVLRESY